QRAASATPLSGFSVATEAAPTALYTLSLHDALPICDPMLSTHPTPEEDVLYGSYGLDQCLDLAAGALERGRARDVAAYGARPDRSEERRVGTGGTSRRPPEPDKHNGRWQQTQTSTTQ